MKNVPKPLTKSVLIPLRLKVAASSTDTPIHKKNVWIGCSSINYFEWRNE